MINLQIAFIRKFVQNTAQVSDKNKTALKVVFLHVICFVQSLIRAFYVLYLSGEKECICRLPEVFSPQINKKRLGPQIRKVSHLRKVRISS